MQVRLYLDLFSQAPTVSDSLEPYSTSLHLGIVPRCALDSRYTQTTYSHLYPFEVKHLPLSAFLIAQGLAWIALAATSLYLDLIFRRVPHIL